MTGNEARVRVTFAGPLVSVQDGGRPGNLRFGVPASGPMDRLAHKAANAALFRATDAAAIEVSTGGLTLVCDAGCVTLAVTGGASRVQHNGELQPSWTVLTLEEGDTLSIAAGASGSWSYLAFAGVLDARTWLGHVATHTLSGLGGGLVSAGQVLVVRDAQRLDARTGEIPARKGLSADVVRVVMGPQDRHFQAGAIQALTDGSWTLSSAYDRMGVRLEGPGLALKEVLSIPSEPVLKGSIQVSGEGVPTVLLADHQTTGGYPKIATVIASDLDDFTQRRAGDAVSFEPISAHEATLLSRERAVVDAAWLEEVAAPRRSLGERLMQENLIAGVTVG